MATSAGELVPIGQPMQPGIGSGRRRMPSGDKATWATFSDMPEGMPAPETFDMICGREKQAGRRGVSIIGTISA